MGKIKNFKPNTKDLLSQKPNKNGLGIKTQATGKVQKKNNVDTCIESENSKKFIVLKNNKKNNIAGKNMNNEKLKLSSKPKGKKNVDEDEESLEDEDEVSMEYGEGEDEDSGEGEDEESVEDEDEVSMEYGEDEDSEEEVSKESGKEKSEEGEDEESVEDEDEVSMEYGEGKDEDSEEKVSEEIGKEKSEEDENEESEESMPVHEERIQKEAIPTKSNEERTQKKTIPAKSTNFKNERRILIQNLPIDINMPDLVNWLPNCPIMKITLRSIGEFKNRIATKKSSVSAIVHFLNTADATKSFEMNGKEYQSRKIKIEFITDDMKTNRSVQVKNLGLAVDRECLEKFFSECGKIEDCNYSTKFQPFGSKVAFVTFCDENSAHAAIKLSRSLLNGRKVIIFMKHPNRKPFDKKQNNFQNPFVKNGGPGPFSKKPGPRSFPPKLVYGTFPRYVEPNRHPKHKPTNINISSDEMMKTIEKNILKKLANKNFAEKQSN